MMRCLAWVVAGCCLASAQAQEVAPVVRDLIEQRVEAIAEQLGDDSGVDLSALAEQLLDRLNDPLDLNTATAEELQGLYMLTEIQVNAIMAHRARFGPFISIYELQVVDELDLATVEEMRPFITVHAEGSSRTPLRTMLANGGHEVLLRTQVGIQQRKGFLGGGDPFGSPWTDPDGDALPDVDDPHVLDSLRKNGKVYLGSPWKAYARYRFRYRQRISFGITAEKDEGEEFFHGSQPEGFDFYSAHLFLRDLGPVKALALGDYQARFGQGLVFASGLSYARKSPYTMNIMGNGQGLAPYTSVNENQFMRGAGATVGIGRHMEATAFISHKRLDGNVAEADTLAEGFDPAEVTFSSFQEDGYHRTTNELSKKHTIEETVFGGNVRYQGTGWSVGATAARAEFGGSLQKGSVQPYNRFEFQGEGSGTYGMDWNVVHRNITWFGEGARSGNGGLAGVSGLLAALDKRLSVALLYRDLQRDFQGLYSTVFSESSSPWNERGLYTGIEVRATRQWTFNAYFDQFTFPWLRYQTDGLSHGHEALGQLTWTPSKQVQLYVKARYQNKPRNAEGAEEGVSPVVRTAQTNLRFNASYRVSPGITLRTRVETVDFQRGESVPEHGFLLYQDLIHRPKQGRLEFTGRVALFSTDSYDARLYAFESDVPGVFSLPPIYGRGLRWYGMVRWSVARGVDVWARYGSWAYLHQEVIGSGLQEISGDRRSDLKLELRLKF